MPLEISEIEEGFRITYLFTNGAELWIENPIMYYLEFDRPRQPWPSYPKRKIVRQEVFCSRMDYQSLTQEAILDIVQDRLDNNVHNR